MKKKNNHAIREVTVYESELDMGDTSFAKPTCVIDEKDMHIVEGMSTVEDIPIEEVMPTISVADVLTELPTPKFSVKEIPITEPAHNIIVEKSTKGLSISSDLMLQQPCASPYTTRPVKLLIGPDKVIHYVPKHLLPPRLDHNGSEERLHLFDMEIGTGHTLIHYFHTGTYETIDMKDDFSTLRTSIKFKQAFAVYLATINYDILGLDLLAISEMKDHASRLDLVKIIRAIKDDFQRLGTGSWMHGYLQQRARSAFEHDHTVFTSEAFLENLDNPNVNRFMMKCVTEIYDNKISDMLSREKEMSESLSDCLQSIRVLSEKKIVPELNIETPHRFITPLANESISSECCSNETFQEDLVSDEDFCTISCPSSECPNELEELPEEFMKCSMKTAENFKDINDCLVEAAQKVTERSTAKECGREPTGSHLAPLLKSSEDSALVQSKTAEKKEKQAVKREKKKRKREELREMRELWEMTKQKRLDAAAGGSSATELVDQSKYHNEAHSGPSWSTRGGGKHGEVNTRIANLRAALASILDDVEAIQSSPDI